MCVCVAAAAEEGGRIAKSVNVLLLLMRQKVPGSARARLTMRCKVSAVFGAFVVWARVSPRAARCRLGARDVFGAFVDADTRSESPAAAWAEAAQIVWCVRAGLRLVALVSLPRVR